MKPASLADLKSNAAAMAGRMRTMSHPERLLMLCRMDEGEVSVTELVALSGLSQSAVSQHLALLRTGGSGSSHAHGRHRPLRPPPASGSSQGQECNTDGHSDQLLFVLAFH